MDGSPSTPGCSFYVWAIRGADGGSAGLEFARAKVEPSDTVLVHAAPARLDVEVFADGERLVATGRDLQPTETMDSPMTRLTIDGSTVHRRAVWPAQEDLGSIVLLPGGEAGQLRTWTTPQDRRSWVWTLELRGGMA
ncbi:MAG: hypothetical protein M3O29_00540 [Actinomycetota bacterium]|nr:hypothetical protein [Actinomycetota bacterium]